MKHSEENISGIQVHTFENPRAQDKMQTICIGGAVSLPQHFAKMAEHWGLTHVLDNPIHAGIRKRRENWQDELFDDMYRAIEILRKNAVVRLVGHSRGNMAVSELASRLNENCETGIGVREIVAINPPLELPGIHNSSGKDVVWDSREQRMMDLIMGPLCYDMSNEEYGKFIRELCERYTPDKQRDVHIHEVKTISDTEVARVIAALEAQTAAQTLIVLGGKDPWNRKDGKPVEMKLSRGRKPIIFENGGHYLPSTKGKQIAEIVSAWSWGIDVGNSETVSEATPRLTV